MSEEVNITIELVKLAIRFEEKGECHIKKITLEDMLDLYQKEKEKNKELDKIKEIIEDYYKRKGIAELTINKIEELLEEL